MLDHSPSSRCCLLIINYIESSSLPSIARILIMYCRIIDYIAFQRLIFSVQGQMWPRPHILDIQSQYIAFVHSYLHWVVMLANRFLTVIISHLSLFEILKNLTRVTIPYRDITSISVYPSFDFELILFNVTKTSIKISQCFIFFEFE